MPQTLADELYGAITRELPELQQVTEEQSAEILRPDGWTRKQELGHLIDSAANNHLRFVNAAIQDEFRGPTYAQNEWVRLHGYDELPWSSLVHFWFRYNSLLVQVLQRIPAERFEAPCHIGAHHPESLAFVVNSYTLHMQHHIDQILHRDEITQYTKLRPLQIDGR
jgi:hypothetical protein